MARFISNDYSNLEQIYNYSNKFLNKNNIDVVITHGSCPDGFMSSTVAKQWLLSKNIKNTTFINAYYGTDYSHIPELVRNKNVLICDFSFSEKITQEIIITTNNNLLILDHHKTAIENLQNIPNENKVFDISHSGAFITYTYFYGFVNIPNCILYIEDNDLWNNKLQNTKEITAYISTMKYDYNEYITLFTNSFLMNTVIPLGKGMVAINNVYIKQISQKAIISFFEIGDKYYFASFINSPILKNEIGNNLLSYHKNNNFSVVFTNNFIENITIFSLRSDNNKTDTTEISKLYGGGGHRNASGLVINKITNNFSSNILDNNVSYYELENIEVIIIKEKKYITLKIKNSKNINELLKYLIQKRYSYNEEQEGLYCMRNKKNNQLLQEYYEGSIGIMDDKILFCKNNEIIKLKKIEDI